MGGWLGRVGSTLIGLVHGAPASGPILLTTQPQPQPPETTSAAIQTFPETTSAVQRANEQPQSESLSGSAQPLPPSIRPTSSPETTSAAVQTSPETTSAAVQTSPEKTTSAVQTTTEQPQSESPSESVQTLPPRLPLTSSPQLPSPVQVPFQAPTQAFVSPRVVQALGVLARGSIEEAREMREKLTLLLSGRAQPALLPRLRSASAPLLPSPVQVLVQAPTQAFLSPTVGQALAVLAGCSIQEAREMKMILLPLLLSHQAQSGTLKPSAPPPSGPPPSAHGLQQAAGQH